MVHVHHREQALRERVLAAGRMTHGGDEFAIGNSTVAIGVHRLEVLIGLLRRDAKAARGRLEVRFLHRAIYTTGRHWRLPPTRKRGVTNGSHRNAFSIERGKGESVCAQRHLCRWRVSTSRRSRARVIGRCLRAERWRLRVKADSGAIANRAN